MKERQIKLEAENVLSFRLSCRDRSTGDDTDGGDKFKTRR